MRVRCPACHMQVASGQLAVTRLPLRFAFCSDAMASLTGIKQVELEDTEVRITYDLLEAIAEQIEATSREAGARLGGGSTVRLRRARAHYAEDCETANMEVSDRGHTRGR